MVLLLEVPVNVAKVLRRAGWSTVSHRMSLSNRGWLANRRSLRTNPLTETILIAAITKMQAARRESLVNLVTGLVVAA
jgi:hypothetical protein